jgi:hypothetical protein
VVVVRREREAAEANILNSSNGVGNMDIALEMWSPKRGRVSSEVLHGYRHQSALMT